VSQSSNDTSVARSLCDSRPYLVHRRADSGQKV